jgi:hypothetical protein
MRSAIANIPARRNECHDGALAPSNKYPLGRISSVIYSKLAKWPELRVSSTPFPVAARGPGAFAAFLAKPQAIVALVDLIL